VDLEGEEDTEALTASAAASAEVTTGALLPSRPDAAA
jgi:hypothetical protein